MKRIGEILVTNGWIETSILQRALVKQKTTGQRLCSLLVTSGVLGADDAACALGEQHGVAAALQRHINGRDRSLAALLSAELARACIALPIGRMGSGEVIVCVRDPSPALETQLARAMKERIRLAVAPAHQLEELVLETYGPDDANEFDVDLGTGPVMSLELDEEQIEAMSDDAMADLGSLELVDLDEEGVSRDASQNQAPIGNQRPTTLPPTNIVTDAPSYRSSTGIVVDAPSQRPSAPIVVDAPSQREPPGRAALASAGPIVTDAPSQRSSAGIVVDAPSQREPPGRAALAAAGIAVPRTQTPRSSLDAAAGIAVSRTQTPPRSSLDAAAGVAVSRTQTPPRSSLDAAAGIAVSRTQTPPRSSLDTAADVAVSRSHPSRSSLDAAADAAAEIAAAAAAAEIAAAIADGDLGPAGAAPVIGRPPAPVPAPVAPALPRIDGRPTPASRDSTPGPARPPAISLPPIAPPPRADQPRVPAALAALQRASSTAARTSTPRIPALPPKIALGTESQGAPVPEEIAQGTQLPTAALAVSPRLAEAIKAMTAAGTPDAICDALIAFATKRWSAVLLLDIDGLEATGRRAHGAQMSDDLAQWIVMSIDEPSLLQSAVMTTSVATATRSGHGDVEDRLQKLLGMARAPSAISIASDGRPGFLLAVGDPDGDDLKTAAADLERLARAAGDAFTRLRGR